MDWDKVEEQVKEGFISKQRHPSFPLTIYNYTHKCQYDWAWTPETIACRGIIRRDDGQVVSRPFPKFFSVEQLNGNLPDGPFDVYEKLDGSLGVSYFDSAGYVPYIATRGSFVSEQAGFATELLHRKYRKVQLNPAFTYLWEVIYPSNRIVVDYGATADIFLLAIIETETGREVPLTDIGFPMARHYDGIKDFSELAAKEEANQEGFVLHFKDSGQRVKVKFAEYKRLHKILTGLTARHIWEALQIPDGLAPILERVPDEFYQWVKSVEGELLTAFTTIETTCQVDFANRPDGDRKTIAENFKTKRHPAVLFRMLDGRPYSDLIWKQLYPEASKPFKIDEE